MFKRINLFSLVAALLIGAVTSAYANTTDLVGTLPAKFSVDNKGAANYSIPIELPPGVNGMQPSVSLNYNSNNGNGVAGLGWSLVHGYPNQIVRGRNIMARDGSLREVNFTAEDKLYLDGKRLIPVTGTHGAAGTQYRTEVEDFSKIDANLVSTDESATFTLTAKSGITMDFGGLGATDGYATTLLGGNAGDVHLDIPYAWKLRQVENPTNGYIKYDYGNILDANSNNTGEYVLEEIHYGSNESQEDPVAKVVFIYENRLDHRQYYKWGGAIPSTQILKYIDVYSLAGSVETQLSRYTLNYEVSHSTFRSLLMSVQRTSYINGVAHNIEPTSFKYRGELDEAGGQKAYEKFRINDINTMPDVSFFAQQRYLARENEAAYVDMQTGDVNGDGATDLVFAYGDNVGQNSAIGVVLGGPDHDFEDFYSVDFRGSENLYGNIQAIRVGDTDGDGVDDIVFSLGSYWAAYRIPFFRSDSLSYGQPSLGPSGEGYALVGGSRITKADFDGDGRDDYTKSYQYLVESERGAVPAGYSTGIFDQQPVTHAPDKRGNASGFGGFDMNGDGMGDYVLIYKNRYDGGSGTYVELSNGNGYHPEEKWSNHGYNEIGQIDSLGDFNGDGLPDGVYRKNGDLHVLINTGSRLKEPENWTLNVPSVSQNGLPSFRDVNGDGLDDYIVKWSTSHGGFKVYLSNGYSFLPHYVFVPGSLPRDIGGNWDVQVFAGSFFPETDTEFGGSGLADFITGGLTGSFGVSYNKGEVADYLTEIRDGLGAVTYIDYTNSTSKDHYSLGAEVQYPIREKRSGHIRVVSDIWKDSGAGSDYIDSNSNGKWDSGETINSDMYHISYQYSGFRTDLSGRGDLGFHSFVTFDHQTNLLKYQFLSQSFPTTGLVKREQTYRADNVVYDNNGNITSLDLQPITSQDNDVVFDEVIDAPGGSLTGTVFPFMSHSRELRWEFSIANPLTLDADDPESLFTEYNDEYAANRALAHSELETYVWFDEQDTASLPETELPSSFDDPANAPPGTQDASPVGFMDWLTEVPSFGLPQDITYGNMTRIRVNYSDGYKTDTHNKYFAPSPANGNRNDLIEWTQIVADTPTASNQGSPVTRFTYNDKGQVETKTTDTQATGSGNSVAPVLNAAAGSHLNTKETYTYSSTGLLEKTELEDFTSDALYDIDGGSKIITSEVSDFDPTGRFPKTVENAYGHSSTSTFDAYGRVLSATDINNESATTEYDGLGRVISAQDNLRGLSTVTTLNSTDGQSGLLGPQSVTVPAAVSATGLSLTSKYYSREVSTASVPITTHFDRLGRVIRVISEGYAGKVTFADTIYNVRGQVIAQSNPYEQGETAYWSISTFDDAGRVKTVTDPNGTVTTNTYLGRVLQVEVDAPMMNGVDPAPQTTTTLKNVRGETVKVWNADNVSTAITQTSGDSDPSLEFIYDGFGQMTETKTRQGAGEYVSLTVAYDALGNQTQLVDPDKGQWDYVYDSLGRNRQQTDANQNVTVNTYDILSRNLTRTITEPNNGPVETTRWYYYDTAENSGKPHVVVDPDHQWIGSVQREELDLGWSQSPEDRLRNYSNANSFYYDDKGNNYLMLQHIDNKWFYTHTAFDSLSRPETVTHFWRPPHLEHDSAQEPGVWQSYGYTTSYDAESYVTEVTDTHGKTWWKAHASEGYDYLDRPVLFQKGGPNGPWTDQYFDPKAGNLRFTTTGDLSGISASAGIQENEYRYDGLGNLVYRSDGVHSTSETFSYDVLNRLEDASVGSTTLAYTYHANGNIKTKEDVTDTGSGTYAYHATKVHAVTSAFDYTIDYDSNGNVNARTGNGEAWSFKWAGFDKPRWMGRENASNIRGSAFVYGANQMRLAHYKFEGFDQSGGAAPSDWQPNQFTDKKLYFADGAVELDYKNATPAGPDDWEMKTVRVAIPAPGNNVGTAELDPNGSSSADHKYLVYHYGNLGSIQAITDWGVIPNDTPVADESGKDSVYSYDPWGQRRDAGDWIGEATSQSTYTWGADDAATASTNEDDLIPRGYTGHEMMDELGLVHMNGRIYDPQLGRFLSADLVVQFPLNLQTYNRYTYVGNNPLGFVDPSGYTVELVNASYTRAQRLFKARSSAGSLRFFEESSSSPNISSFSAKHHVNASAAAEIIDVIVEDLPAVEGLESDEVESDLDSTVETDRFASGGEAESTKNYLKIPGDDGKVYVLKDFVVTTEGEVRYQPEIPDSRGLSDSTLDIATLAVTPPFVKSATTALGKTLSKATNKTVKALPAPRPTATLTQDGLDHIVLRHFPSSGARNAGKFAPGTTGRDLKSLINETVGNGAARPNTRNRPGQIFELDFGRPIGTNIQGNPATQLRVVVRPDGTVTTAFPF
ncbi:MAG: RHS repeat-associated core domain-containing protein [Verrucomicrobiota bacterium]